ncbi:hypothetical protein GCM10009730_41730 [Streptomyces albidochromogenes]
MLTAGMVSSHSVMCNAGSCRREGAAARRAPPWHTAGSLPARRRAVTAAGRSHPSHGPVDQLWGRRVQTTVISPVTAPSSR